MTDFNTATEIYNNLNDGDMFMNMPLNFKEIPTRLGAFTYMSEDVYTFEEGLAGFKNSTLFAKSELPNLKDNDSYGMLQSLDDHNLSFILFYPKLDDTQLSVVAQKVRTILQAETYHNGKSITFSRSNIQVGFLVTIENDDNGQQVIGCVSDAPLVFLTDLKKAWQLVLS